MSHVQYDTIRKGTTSYMALMGKSNTSQAGWWDMGRLSVESEKTDRKRSGSVALSTEGTFGIGKIAWFERHLFKRKREVILIELMFL